MATKKVGAKKQAVAIESQQRRSKTLHILCLHGKSQNKEVFRTRLGRIPHKCKDLAIFFTDIEAPHCLPLSEGDEVNMRTWFNRTDDGYIERTSLEETLAFLMDIWTTSSIPFDGCFGFSQGGAMASLIASMPHRFPNLKFCICIGAPEFKLISDELQAIPSNVYSLHMAGEADPVVSVESSRSLASRYPQNHCKFATHEYGHCIPMKAEVINEIRHFLETLPDASDSLATTENSIPNPLLFSTNNSQQKAHFFLCESDSIASQQMEEIEALLAIFPDIINVINVHPSETVVKVPCSILEVQLCPKNGDFSSSVPPSWIDSLGLKLFLTPKYPDEESPEIEISLGRMSMVDFNEECKSQLLSKVNQAAQECIGSPALYCIIQAALDWLRDGQHSAGQPDAPKELKDEYDSEGDANEAPLALSELRKDAIILKNPIIASLLNDQENKDAEDMLETERVRQATREAASLAGALKKLLLSDPFSSSVNSKASPIHSSDQTLLAASAIAESLKSYSCTITASSRGLWKYTVGLIGKPSAGKSTFYNACTQACLERDGRRLAAVAPHPFTTIEPNVGPGWFAGPLDMDDTAAHGSLKRGALHGRDKSGRRLLPVIVKDVAGLVPGAYKGRGKGNRFLNDLCDADVLIHVVDATGRSDKDGNVLTDSNGNGKVDGEQGGGSSPSEDAQWIREELHRWIYGNVKAKWPSVIRKLKSVRAADQHTSTAKRLFQLFSGYQAPKSCVELASLRSQLSIDDAYSWTVLDLHRLVANYLLIRFPVCLALNKVDAFPSQDGKHLVPEVIRLCQEDASARGEVAVPVSAISENWLLQKQVKTLDEKDALIHSEQEKTLQRVLETYGSTGVLDALSAAVFLRPPIFCYPVSDLDTEAPVGWTSGKGDESNFTLMDCLLFKPGSTVGDVFDALRKGALPHVTLAGEFVRAEGRGLSRASKKKQVGKDTTLDDTCCVLRIQTNRKAIWQQSLKKLN